MPKLFKIHLALFGANLIYAGNYTIAKEVMPVFIQPFGFILIRVSMASLLFWGVWAMFVREKVARKDIPLLMLCGLFGVAVNQLLFFKGLSITTPINAALIMVTTPILVLVVSAILIKEKVTIMKMVGIGMGAIGAGLLIGYGQTVVTTGEGRWGDLFVFLNACSYGIYLVIVKPLMHKYNPLTIITWVFTFGLVVVLPFGYEEFGAIPWEALPDYAWWCIAYVVIGTTFLAYLLNMTALKAVNPTIVGIYIYLQPVLASIIAITFGKDALDWVKIIATVLIFAGVYMVSKRYPQPHVKTNTPAKPQ